MNALEMPSSGIVVVEQNADHNQPLQPSQQTQQQVQQQLGQTHQVLVGDELISTENIVTGGCQYITTSNDLLNNAQIIKFVNEEDVALIEQQQQHQQLQHDEMYGQPQQPPQQHLIQTVTASNPNSKVHVISNVTIVSKPQLNQQHTIGFVNNKPMASSAPSFVNTYLSSKIFPTATAAGGGGATGKVVNVPYKCGAQLSSPQQQQNTSVVNHKHGIGALVQKVSVPRYVTRLPAMPNATPTNNSNLVIARGGGIAPPINSVIQTHQVQKQHNIQTVSPAAQPASPLAKANHVRPTNKTSAVASSIKVMHAAVNVAAPPTTKLGGTKTIPAQHLPKSHTKTPKIIKHYNNSIYNPQQAQQQNHKSINIHVQQTSNNNNNNNNASNTTITTKTLQQQQQRPVYNNIYLQGAVRGTKFNKYTVQQSVATMSNLMINQQQQSTVSPQQQHHLKLATGSNQYQSSVQQSNMSGGVSGTIKYVNAQGNVIAAAPTRSSRHIPEPRTQPMDHQTHQLMYSTELSATEPMPSPSTIASVDDMVMVNGTPMSEEMSARILQSLSQKSIYNNNNNSNINNRHCTTAAPLGSYAKHTVGQQGYLSSPSSDQHHQPVQFMFRTSVSDTSEPNNKVLHEYFKVNTCDIQSSSTTLIDNIPLISTRGDTTSSLPGCGNASAGCENEEDIIGEEVLPPLDTRLQLVYAFLQDHTYAAPEPQQQPQPAVAAVPQSPIPHPVAQQLLQSSPSHRQSPQLQSQQQFQYQPAPTTPHKHHLNHQQSHKLQQQAQQLPPPQQIQHQHRPLPSTDTLPVENPQNVISAGSNLTSATFAGGTPAKPGPGFSYVYNPSAEKDDDTHSVISNGRRSDNQMDQGEETDTAPEGDNEEDSVTRCICDLTHDDGYMICCDKCSVWQHVDCVGIDRENIPDEYKCELCQPRPVERTRARALQLLKRKEQQNFLLLNSQALHAQQQQMPLPVDGLPQHIVAAQTGGLTAGAQKPITLPPSSKLAKQRQPASTTGTSTSSKRKSDVPFTVKRKRVDSASRANGKRREPKKVSKRKSASKTPSTMTSVATVEPVVDKQTANLRTWIENYELAMTNHYSPELRARLQAIGKQQQLHNQQHVPPHLRHVSQLDDGKCTTVPHAGGKILISNLDLTPNHAVIEIRGKYMLNSQYKAQPTIPPTGNARSNIYSRNPGPFLFFYRLPNDGPEICVDTRTYGNEARFVRRSCRPNAEIQHTIEKGTIHLYIVSLSQVKSSTEITIKHEPHDLTSIHRGTINAPTSTMCACGLTKDCLFSVASTPSVSTGPSTAAMTAPSTVSKTRSNGNIVLHPESLGAMVPAAPLPPTKPAYRRKNPSKANRNRSTSSSGDSNTGMLSPINNSGFTSVSVASMMNDSGVYMTSSSSSVSLPSPSLPSPSFQPISSLALPQGSPLPFMAGPPLDTTMLQPHVVQVHDQSPVEPEFPPPPPPNPAPVQEKMAYVMQQPLLSPSQQVVHVQQTPLLYSVMNTSIVQMSQTSTMATMTAAGSQVVPIQSAVMTPLPLPETTVLSLPTLAKQPSPTAPIQPMSPQFHNPQLVPHQTIQKPPSPASFQSGESYQPSQQHLPSIVQQSTAVQQLISVPMSPHLTRPTSLQLEEEPATPEAQDPTQHSAQSAAHTTPTQVPSALRSPIPKTLGSGGKKSARKSSCSLSEDSSSMVGDESAVSSKKDSPEPAATSSTKKDGDSTSKKMTREERKMQAIVKAFEKMEKNQLRKQELKQKTPSSAQPVAPLNSQHPQPKQQNQQQQRRRLNSTRTPVKQDIPDDGTASKKSGSSSSSVRKKKRKGSKSYQQISNQRKRFRSRVNSGDSDMVTSEDSTSLLSPTQLPPSGLHQAAAVVQISSPSSSYVNPNIQPSIDQDVTDGSDIGSAAGMLMSLSHCKTTVIQNHDEHDGHLLHLSSPIRLANRSLSEQPTPPFALSSACKFIEAAVGPCERTYTLDNEFKLPPKTKTKKTIMNDWLHQSEPSTSTYSPQQHEGEPIPEHHLQQHVIYPNEPLNHHINDSYPPIQPCQNEPQNLSMAANRIEEFIHITSQDAIDPLNGDVNKWHHSVAIRHSPSPPLMLCDQQPSAIQPLESPTVVHTVPQSLPTPPMQCGSSVKKRWLRQAISEECSDDLTTPLNGYMTPLKKRRMARECSAAAAAAAAIDNCLPTSPHIIPSYDQYKAISLADIIPMVNQPFMPQLNQQPYELTPGLRPVPFGESSSPDVPTFVAENRLEYDSVASIEEPEPIVHSQSSPKGTVVLSEFEEIQVKAKEENVLRKSYGSDHVEYVLNNSEPEEMKVEVAIIGEISENTAEEACKTEFTDEPSEYYDKGIREDDMVLPTVTDESRYAQEECIYVEKADPCVTEEPPVGVNTTMVDESKQVVDDLVKVSIPPQVELRPISATPPVTVETGPETSPIADEFDIKPLEECDIELATEQIKRLESPTPTNTSALVDFSPEATADRPLVSLTNCDEIADIQQRLHSFHNENLLILASRNKKKHSRATTPTCEDGNSSAGETVNPPLKRLRNKRLVFSDIPKEQQDVAKDDVLLPATVEEPLSQSAPLNNWHDSGITGAAATSAAASTIPVFNQFSPYLLNSISSSIPVSVAPCFGIVQPLPPPSPQPTAISSDTVAQLTNAAQALQPTPPSQNAIHPSFYSKFSAEFPDVVQTLSPLVSNNKSMLSDYLEHPNKPSSYSTLNFVSMLDPAPRQPPHSMFATSAPLVSGSFMISKSYSTLDPATSTALSLTMAPTAATNPNSTGTSICPKVLTRTQSADPRLNPSLSAPQPPPAPKRKLSINEYRKRKQQSSDAGLNKARTHSKTAGMALTETTANSCGDSTSSGFFDNVLSSSLLAKSTDEKDTVFSPAPTLLEMQQENLSQRLKNYKSLHGLTTGSVSSATTATTSIGSTSATSGHCDVKDHEIESILKFDSSEMKLSGSYSSLLSMSSSSSSERSATPVNTRSTSSSSSSSSSCDDFNDDHHLRNHRLLHPEENNLSPGESTSR